MDLSHIFTNNLILVIVVWLRKFSRPSILIALLCGVMWKG